MRSRVTARCPSCTSVRQRRRATLRNSEIIAALAEHAGQAIDVDDEWDSVDLLRCAECHLEHFDPALPASAVFYEALAGSTEYYETERWDMNRVLKLVRSGDRVIDIGCGGGALLRQLTAHGIRAVGLDRHSPGLESLRSEGFDVREADLETPTLTTQEEFDAAVLLHVLEHVTRPRQLLCSAAEMVRPGGRLIVAVPDRRRIPFADIEALDLPPHHLTRWDERSLRAAAEGVGLEIELLEHERIPLRQAVRHARGRWSRRRGVSRFVYWRSPAQPPQGFVGTRLHRGLSLLAVFHRPVEHAQLGPPNTDS